MQPKRVAILVETSLDSGRQIVRGVSRFARERNDWSIFYHTGPLGAMAPASLESWSGDGIIARIANQHLYEIVASRNVPVVDVLGNVEAARYPLARSDDFAISQLVGSHFNERGFRHIAFFGMARESWSKERKRGLADYCARELDATLHTLEVEHDERDAQSWPAYFAKIRGWITRLPKPVGIMVGSDQFGPDLLAACQQTGFTVPDQVSLVGVDNDLPFCEICQPQLSSVEPNHERVGYEAARVLDEILQRGSTRHSLIAVPPRMLHVRQSSDATALNDPALVKALRFIRAHACEPISVDDIARESGVSRSVLQRRFRSSLSKTVLEAILSVRMSRAQEMLATTDLPLPDVADRCGFRHQEYLGYVFKKRIGCTPGQYRSTRRNKT